MAHDIRMTNPKGFQPQRTISTAERIKLFGWADFQELDSPEALAEHHNKRQFEAQLEKGWQG